jgi:hypothetical protein
MPGKLGQWCHEHLPVALRPHCLYVLKLYEIEAATKVALKPSTIEMQVRPGRSTEKREGILVEWYGQRH